MNKQTEQTTAASMGDQKSDHARRAEVKGAVIAVGVAVVVTAAACATLKPDVFHGWFGPPTVAMAEGHSDVSDGPTFDHGPLDRLLKKHVDVNGWVDYQGLAQDATALDAYIQTLSHVSIDKMNRNERLALLINAYNAFTLRLILDYYPLQSIKDIPSDKRWNDKRWHIGSLTLSLNQIEHEQIRPHFKEPRIHFALVCAAVGCPPLRREAYTADRLGSQLESQSQIVHSHVRWFRFDPNEPEKVYLTSLYNWYRGDFEQVAGSVLAFATGYAPYLKQAIDQGHKPEIRWLDYDWSLNGKQHAP